MAKKPQKYAPQGFIAVAGGARTRLIATALNGGTKPVAYCPDLCGQGGMTILDKEGKQRYFTKDEVDAMAIEINVDDEA